jgi:uncharacterized membrane protein YedE/YeeE
MTARILSSFGAGLLFGLGLVVSGMINPAKVLNFLDVAGSWDPSLAFVMAGAIAVTLIGYRLVFRMGAPLFDGKFSLPERKDIDMRLIGGAVVFGVGWGLIGFCPGPAVTAAALGEPSVYVFLTAMLAGLAGWRWLVR